MLPHPFIISKSPTVYHAPCFAPCSSGQAARLRGERVRVGGDRGVRPAAAVVGYFNRRGGAGTTCGDAGNALKQGLVIYFEAATNRVSGGMDANILFLKHHRSKVVVIPRNVKYLPHTSTLLNHWRCRGSCTHTVCCINKTCQFLVAIDCATSLCGDCCCCCCHKSRDLELRILPQGTYVLCIRLVPSKAWRYGYSYEVPQDTSRELPARGQAVDLTAAHSKTKHTLPTLSINI